MSNNSRINVLMVDSESTWRGGEGQLELLMTGLLENDHMVTLAAPGQSAITARAAKLGVRCLPLTIAGGADLVAAWTLRRYLRDDGYDIIHAHSSHAHSVAFLAWRAARIGKAGDLRRPRLVVSRRVDFPVARNGFSALKYRHGADMYVAISNGVHDVLRDCGIEADRIEIVRSGINLGKFAAVKDNRYLLEEFDIAPETPVVGNIAALAPHKSQVDFIRAAKQVSETVDGVKFFIVGDGKLRADLEREVRAMKLQDNIILTGFRTDVLELLSIFDCFVLSSYLEGLCTSIMDAQAMGIPVVATRTGGVPDLVDDGVTGLLVSPRRPDQLAEAVIRMIREPGLAGRCVDAARAKSRSYDYRDMVRGTLGVYRRMLQNGVEAH